MDTRWIPFCLQRPPRIDVGAQILYNVDDNLPYVAGNDLLLVSREGIIQRLTYLTTQYDALESGYAFSPDEQSIAFWLATDYKLSETEWRFAILDIPSGKVTNYCLSGGNANSPSPAVWSPDGRYVMLTREDHTFTTLTTKVMIVDLVNNTVADLTEDAIGMGWMAREK